MPAPMDARSRTCCAKRWRSTRAGRRHTLAAAALGLSYRHCGVPEDWIFIAARFAGEAGERRGDRRAHGRDPGRRARPRQPVRARTGGSTFANPPGHKAWELIDRAGCRGLRARRRHGVAEALRIS